LKRESFITFYGQTFRFENKKKTKNVKSPGCYLR